MGQGVRDLLLLHELLFLPLPPSPPAPNCIDFLSTSALWSCTRAEFPHSWSCVCCRSGLQCWQSNLYHINTYTTAPCSGRNSMAATLPVSCFPLEDSLKLLHTKRTQKPLLPAEEMHDSWLRISPSYLGLLTAVKIIKILSSIYITLTLLTSYSQSWFFSSQELNYFNARFNSWEAQDCDTVWSKT